MASKPRTGNRERIHDVPGRLPRIDEGKVNADGRKLFTHVMEAVNHLESTFTSAPDTYGNESPISCDIPQGYRSSVGRQQRPIQIEHVDILGESTLKSSERRQAHDYNPAIRLCVLHYNSVCVNGKSSGPRCRRCAPTHWPLSTLTASKPIDWTLQ